MATVVQTNQNVPSIAKVSETVTMPILHPPLVSPFAGGDTSDAAHDGYWLTLWIWIIAFVIMAGMNLWDAVAAWFR